ncbi:hypothetical protein M422DRAFT_261052 [Sphaerobolus stellatus SS14]|uniref:Uncharacterized protein n=1 Tax=Sphaerobolus stellatus (strain SS14) TaxID=990650 RepID=A0A0C9VFY0_SPHS4|nr:hypothetical protein M422DRAFT_261052 [Sphaerobolus stellatus SS14]
MTPNDGLAPPQSEPEGTHAHLNLRLGNQQHLAHPSSSGTGAQDRAPPPPGSGHPTPAPLGMNPSNTGTRTVGISNLPRVPQHNSALTPDNRNDRSSHQQQENDGPRPRAALPNEQRASSPPSPPPYISDEEFEALRARSCTSAGSTLRLTVHKARGLAFSFLEFVTNLFCEGRGG